MALDLRRMFTNNIKQCGASDYELHIQLLDISTWFEEAFESMDIDNKSIYVQTMTPQMQATQ